MPRGYAAIGLNNTKFPVNVGGVMRAAGCYGADLVVVGGPRPKRMLKNPTDTQKAWRHIPTILVDDVFDAAPYKAIPVAVDLIDGATPLMDFKHPMSAFYIFGAEDQTLGKAITSRCAHVVYVPTVHCMNLSAAVNVLLYDRMAKEGKTER